VKLHARAAILDVLNSNFSARNYFSKTFKNVDSVSHRKQPFYYRPWHKCTPWLGLDTACVAVYVGQRIFAGLSLSGHSLILHTHTSPSLAEYLHLLFHLIQILLLSHTPCIHLQKITSLEKFIGSVKTSYHSKQKIYHRDYISRYICLSQRR
jgi:hypothetical protein